MHFITAFRRKGDGGRPSAARQLVDYHPLDAADFVAIGGGSRKSGTCCADRI
jgi:hypothetical protein